MIMSAEIKTNRHLRNRLSSLLLHLPDLGYPIFPRLTQSLHFNLNRRRPVFERPPSVSSDVLNLVSS
jgi:hypothetical protein